MSKSIITFAIWDGYRKRAGVPTQARLFLNALEPRTQKFLNQFEAVLDKLYTIHGNRLVLQIQYPDDTRKPSIQEYIFRGVLKYFDYAEETQRNIFSLAWEQTTGNAFAFSITPQHSKLTYAANKRYPIRDVNTLPQYLEFLNAYELAIQKYILKYDLTEEEAQLFVNQIEVSTYNQKRERFKAVNTVLHTEAYMNYVAEAVKISKGNLTKLSHLGRSYLDLELLRNLKNAPEEWIKTLTTKD